jgi:RNA polymerase sigma-70 factor (ECF subfamily)
MERLSDEQLMAQVMDGERSALAPLVERYHGRLLGYLYRLTFGNRPLAEDLVQDTFVRILQQDSYQPNRPFKPWVYAIATHLVYDYFRSSEQNRTTLLNDKVQPDLPGALPGPEDQAQTADEGQIVMKAIGQLGEEYRTTLLLRFYGGLSLQEIAETLLVPVGTVKSRLSVGTRRLHALLIHLREGAER